MRQGARVWRARKGSVMRRFILACGLALAVQPVAAADFTTAAEVKPILQMQKDSWVAIREFNGQDLVYFTSVLAWHCGLEAVQYGLNGAPAETVLVMEPCHEETASPNALTGEGGEIYIEAPLGSVDSVSLRLIFDDGSEEEAGYERAAVLMP